MPSLFWPSGAKMRSLRELSVFIPPNREGILAIFVYFTGTGVSWWETAGKE